MIVNMKNERKIIFKTKIYCFKDFDEIFRFENFLYSKNNQVKVKWSKEIVMVRTKNFQI